ncbi:hypothetical protein LIER_23122 [Lithospermum erythrorhizon]|uniref:DELLA protein RGL1-like n=1 Tax=Lithospermum erythrorhizon TaxID=34254 RepID=A0AAV3QZH9_LITER
MAQRNQVCDAGIASEYTTPCKEENSMSEKETISFMFQNEPPQEPNSKDVSTSLDDEESCIDSLQFESSDETRKTDVIRLHTSDLECKEEQFHAFPPALFKLCTDYGSGIRKYNGRRITMASNEGQLIKMTKLSTNAIIRLAGEKFIQLEESSDGDLLMAGCLFPYQFSCLSKEEARDAGLVFYLLASAEKVGQKQFDHARKLLDCCDKLSSSEGDPVQRLVFYFSKALNERIDQETMKIRSMNFWKKQFLDVEKELMSIDSTYLAVCKAIPTGLIIDLAAIQAIVDHVPAAKKIHIIDFSIKGGQQHSMLMQALTVQREPPLEHLKITAVTTKSKQKIEETCNRLRSFAQSLKLPFSFNVVIVDDILNLKEAHLPVDYDETVIVYSAFFLRTMLAEPHRLEHLFRVIRNVKPYLMIVAEVETNHNSPVFVTRFVEALFFYGAQFDCLEDCMKNDEPNRFNLESFYYSKGIHNIVAAEGEQRTFSKVKVEVWRAFFDRFGMVETPLDITFLKQAKLVLKDFRCASSFTFDMDGKCLIIGWKETPLYSLSAWKFN